MKTRKMIHGDEENGIAIKKGKVVQIWLTKEIKVSANYNSASTSFGAKATVEGDINTVRERLAKLVDAELQSHMKDMMDFLSAAGGK